MIKKVLDFVEKNRILECGDSVLLGVSGGADSVCLLHVLKELQATLKLTLSVVHVNHGIRGLEAERDADFVKDLCSKLEVKYFREDRNIPKIADEMGMSEEEAGRHARYETFYQAAHEIKANKIAIAHNLNDNSETILFNLFRGTGIKGLTGIPCQRDMIIRPLLCCTRSEIEEYLRNNNWDFCVDSTNKTTEYSRNRIRLELLPYIQENINNKAEYNIVNAAKNLEEIADYLECETDKIYDEFVREDVILNGGFSVHNALFCQVIRRLIERQAGRLKDVTRTHVMAVAELRYQQVSKSVDLPYNLVAERVYEGIRIKKKNNIDELCNGDNLNEIYSEPVLIDGRIIENSQIKITFETAGFNSTNIEELVYTKWLDYDKIERLTLRKRQPGDYIVVDNQGSRKKLKDYFINEKIPKEKRDDLLLLADGKHVVWIIGYRISSYYKVSDSTSRIIKITYEKKS